MMPIDFGLHIHFFIPNASDGYDCTGIPQDQLLAKSSWNLGIFFLFLGILATFLYGILLKAMSDKEILNNSALKLIYFNCWIDLASIATGGLITGVLFLSGDSFCTNQLWIFATGAIRLGCWSASCVICLTLAVNQLCIFYKIEFGKNCWIIILIAIVYGTFMATCTRPLLFNAAQGSWFFVPNIHPGSEEDIFTNSYFLMENCITLLITPIIYIFISLKLYFSKQNEESESVQHRKVQISIFWQSLLICSLICIASALFVYMQIFSYPPWLPTAAEVAYQIFGTLPAAVLLVLNGKIRSRALECIPFYRRHATAYTVSNRNKSEPSSSQGVQTRPRQPKRSNRRIIDIWKAAPISSQSITSLG